MKTKIFLIAILLALGLGAAYYMLEDKTGLNNLLERAEQGDALAQWQLANRYSLGLEGVSQSDQEAFQWYRLAANQGLARAQLKLGLAYGQGKGVLQDDQESVRWYRLAADQGNANAQYNLAIMYAKGQGVEKDYVRAYMWSYTSNSLGFETAAKFVRGIGNAMTPAQIAEAQKLAQEWTASH
ncbi:MAG: hypothetical protein DRR42_17590 [Gammaproteobacteria bacterium]|nr:MAG: hypothetical protein DRR42_17590 [Gammaproteobacteria bacterium]